jgi:peptidoglycan/LPS O-acetylase OafA/YrhL
MICIPWKLLFVNFCSQIFGFDKAHLPVVVWVIYVAALIPLAALSHAAIEVPARLYLRNGLRWPGRVLTSVA